MSVVIELPAVIEKRLREEFENFEVEGREAMLVELYRQDKISHHELGQSLGLSRLEVDALFKRHQVTEDLPSIEEYEAALKRLREITRK